MTTSSIKEIWQLIEKFRDEVELLMTDEALVFLIYLDRHQGIASNKIIKRVEKYFGQPSALMHYLLSNEFIEEKEGLIYLTKKGQDIAKIIEYSQCDVKKLPKNIITGYALQAVLGEGSTSVTYKAESEKTGFDVVLKIFKPGILDHVNFKEKIKKMGNLVSVPNLVIPQDYGEIKWNNTNLKYIVIEYVKGDSLGKFLREDKNVDLEETLKNYIKEVGGTLKIIQENGFNHGDLHENNVLMVEDELYKGRNIFHFKVIDFIGVDSNKEFRQFELSDMLIGLIHQPL